MAKVSLFSTDDNRRDHPGALRQGDLLRRKIFHRSQNERQRRRRADRNKDPPAREQVGRRLPPRTSLQQGRQLFLAKFTFKADPKFLGRTLRSLELQQILYGDWGAIVLVGHDD